MQITRDEDKKKNHKSWQGAGPSYWLCGTKQKAPCTIQKEGERRKHQNTAAKKQNYPVCMNVCVCTNDNPAVLQPADHSLSGSPGGWWRWGARAPSCVHVCFLQSSVYLEQRICWWHAEGSDSDTGVSPVTHSLCTTVPRLHNKLKNKYK